MRQQTQPVGITKAADERPESFRIIRQPLAPCRITLGDLLLGKADFGRVVLGMENVDVKAFAAKLDGVSTEGPPGVGELLDRLAYVGRDGFRSE
jgi:hypothetical protein